MRWVGIGIFVAASALAIGSTEKDHARKLTERPDMSEREFTQALRKIDRETVAMMEERHVPGLSMSVVRDGKVVWLKGYGYQNLEKKIRMTPDTITQIASCSKAFTSTLALMAVQDGKIALDDPVRKYLPYFRLMDPEANEKMTVADLMCHSSGLPRTDQGWWTDAINDEECVRLLANCEPTYKFRENGQYSNILVNTASMVTAKAYGKPWPELLKERIAGPLGMTSTSADPTSALDKDRLSIGYWFNPVSNAVERERYDEGRNIIGAGEVKSTARDLSHWLQFHLAKGEFEGKRILDSKILEEAYKPRQTDAFGLGAFGLGWYLDNRWPVPVIEHGGDLQGFQSLVCLIPSKHIGIEFSDNNDAAGLRPALLDKILTILIGGRDTKWDDQPFKETGVFVDPTASKLLRIYPDGSLWAVIDPLKPIRLNRTGWREYKTADPRNQQLKVTFSDDPTNKGKTQATLEMGVYTAVYRQRVKFNAGITAAALMDKSVAAYGGAANLGKQINLVAHYDFIQRQEGLTGLGLMVRSGNDLGEMERLYWGDRYLATTLTGVNSESGGYTETHDRMDPLVGAGLVDAQIDAEICQAFGWRSKFKKVEIIARLRLGDESVLVVRKEPKQSPTEVIDFVSEKSGLVLRREAGNPASITEFADFRPVEGVILPHKITTIDPGLHVEEMTIRGYEKVARYLHWAFNPLGSAKTP